MLSHPIGGVTIGVVVADKLVFTKSYGYLDMEKKAAATDDTVYRIGSITKQFTALMLLQLAEQGKLHFSDPVEKHFPEVNEIQGTFPRCSSHLKFRPRRPKPVSLYRNPALTFFLWPALRMTLATGEIDNYSGCSGPQSLRADESRRMWPHSGDYHRIAGYPELTWRRS